MLWCLSRKSLQVSIFLWKIHITLYLFQKIPGCYYIYPWKSLPATIYSTSLFQTHRRLVTSVKIMTTQTTQVSPLVSLTLKVNDFLKRVFPLCFKLFSKSLDCPTWSITFKIKKGPMIRYVWIFYMMVTMETIFSIS